MYHLDFEGRPTEYLQLVIYLQKHASIICQILFIFSLFVQEINNSTFYNNHYS